jgi:tetratricopeptide (TPR) repeat protein
VLGSKLKILTLIFLVFFSQASTQANENYKREFNRFLLNEYDKQYDLLEYNPDSVITRNEFVIKEYGDVITRYHHCILNVQLGYCYQVKKDYGTALSFLYEAKNYVDPEKNAAVRASIMASIGDTYKDQGNYQLAKDNYQSALKFAREKNIYSEQCWSLRAIGDLEYEHGNYTDAIFYFLEAYKLFDKHNDNIKKASVISSIADIYKLNNELDSAIKYYQEASNIYLSNSRMRNYVAVQHNLALVYLDQAKYDSSKLIIERVIEIENDTPGSNYRGNSYNSLANIYEEMDSIQLALKYYQRAYELNVNEGRAESICINLINIGHIYYTQGYTQKAIDYYDKALKVDGKENITDIKKYTYKYLAELYETVGNYKKAYHFQNLYAEYKDSLFNETDRKTIAKHFSNFKLDQKNSEKEEVLSKKDLAELELKDQKTQTLFLYFGLTSLLAVTFFFFSKYRQRSKDKKNLIFSSQQLEKVVSSLEREKYTRETEQKKMKSEIASIQKSLSKEKEFNRFRFQLLGIISNEFKETLGEALLKMDNIKLALPDHDEYVMMNQERDIKLSIFSIMKMIDKASLIYKDFDDIQLRIEEIDILKLLDSILLDFKEQSKYRQMFDVDIRCLSTVIKSDRKNMEMLFSGLFSYAVKNSRQEMPIKIDFTERKDVIIIKIEDSSYGMSDEEKQLILQPVIEWNSPFLADIKERLGLILANQCAQLLRGQIKIQGEYVVGNIYEVSLPRNYFEANVSERSSLGDGRLPS